MSDSQELLWNCDCGYQLKTSNLCSGVLCPKCNKVCSKWAFAGTYDLEKKPHTIECMCPKCQYEFEIEGYNV